MHESTLQSKLFINLNSVHFWKGSTANCDFFQPFALKKQLHYSKIILLIFKKYLTTLDPHLIILSKTSLQVSHGHVFWKQLFSIAGYPRKNRYIIHTLAFIRDILGFIISTKKEFMSFCMKSS